MMMMQHPTITQHYLHKIYCSKSVLFLLVSTSRFNLYPNSRGISGIHYKLTSTAWIRERSHRRGIDLLTDSDVSQWSVCCSQGNVLL